MCVLGGGGGLCGCCCMTPHNWVYLRDISTIDVLVQCWHCETDVDYSPGLSDPCTTLILQLDLVCNDPIFVAVCYVPISKHI